MPKLTCLPHTSIPESRYWYMSNSLLLCTQTGTDILFPRLHPVIHGAIAIVTWELLILVLMHLWWELAKYLPGSSVPCSMLYNSLYCCTGSMQQAQRWSPSHALGATHTSWLYSIACVQKLDTKLKIFHSRCSRSHTLLCLSDVQLDTSQFV